MASVLQSTVPISAQFRINPVSSYAQASSFQAPAAWQKNGLYAPPEAVPQRAQAQSSVNLKQQLGNLPSIFQFNISNGSN